MPTNTVRPAARIAVWYVLFGVAWVFGSDHLVSELVSDPDLHRIAQTVKGWAFVVLSGAFVFWLVHREVRRRAAAAEGLRESRARSRVLMEQMPAVVWTTDTDLRFRTSAGAALEAIGRRPGSVVGLTVQEYFGTSDPDFPPVAHHRRALGGTPGTYEVEWASRSFRAHVEPLRGPDGEIEGVVGVALDVTEQKEAEAALRRSEERFRTLFEQSQDAVYITSRDGRILEMNRAGLELFGYRAHEIRGLNVRDLYLDPAERRRFQAVVERTGSVQGFETRVVTKAGEVADILITAAVRRDGDGEVAGYHGIIRDITDRKRFERELERRALHDPLTELPNRVLFGDRVEHALERARRSGGRIAVLFVDLDRFKSVNDSFGHPGGDEVLVEVARRIRGALRAEDTVARFGGDEFTILLEGLREPAEAERAAERVLGSLEAPFTLQGTEFQLHASVGITVGPEGVDGVDGLLRRADAAMYRAKGRSGLVAHVFDPAEDAEATGQLQRQAELREALERREFEVHYQPIVSLEDGAVRGLEPLARWRHPERGLLLPEEFIGFAEETALIVPLGLDLLERAMVVLREGDLAGWPPLRLHPNLAAPQLEDSALPEELARLLREVGLEPDRIHFEVTERLAMESPERLEGLRALGAGIALDDFGTGYSSLSHLKRLRVEAVKIDRSFVRGVITDPRDEAIVRTIITLGKTLGLEVIAEGIETEAQARRLRELGCPLAQGFHFARPLASADLDAFMASAAEAAPAELGPAPDV